jgi:hypothetical protein
MNGIAILILSIGAAAPLAAQASSPTPVCLLRPGPLARFNTWLVTEAAIEVPFATTKHIISAGGDRESDFESRFVLSIGLMKNIDADHAAGIVLGHDLNRSISRAPTRVEARVRKWNGASAFDLSAGLTRKGVQDVGDVAGFTAAVGGEWRYLGADARLDLHNADGRTVAAGFIGARATSAAAPLAALAVFGAIAAIIISTGAGS